MVVMKRIINRVSRTGRVYSHSRRVHTLLVACLKITKNLHCNVVSANSFSIFLSCNSSLTFSCTAISCLAFLCPANSCTAISCPAILTVLQFSGPSFLVNPYILIMADKYSKVYMIYRTAPFQRP